MEPLIFSSISNSINAFKSFNIDNMYNLVENFFSQDFIKQKKKKRKKKKSSYDTSIVTLYLDTIVWPSQLKIPSSAIECRTVQLSY